MISYKTTTTTTTTTFNVGLYSGIYRATFFKLRIITETTNFYILVSVLTIFTITQGHSCMGNRNIGVHFLGNFAADQDEIQNDATTCALPHCEIYFVQVTLNGENSADVVLYDQHCPCRDTCEPIVSNLVLH